MKLFGGGGSHHQRSRQASEETADFTPVAVKEKKRSAVGASVGDWLKNHHLIFVIPGCVLLAVLLVVLFYAIWEKPPETREEGPNVMATQAPVATPIPEPSEPPVEETPEPTPEPEPTATPEPTGRREQCYTFLIAAYDQLGANTDTILVGRLDAGEGKLDIVNIPRDTLVNVNWGVKKLNTVLANENNEPARLVEHLSNLLGFEVDCYAIVDVKAVEKLVDCIGGVFYTVPRNMDYDDPTQDLSIHIPSGYQWLNGENAVKVLRYRVGNNNSGYANGDLGRIATQQDFLMTIADQMLSLGNIPNLDKAIEIFEEYVDTDMSVNNIAYFLREFLLLDKEKISFSTLPGEGIGIRGGSYYEVLTDEWLEIVNTSLNPYYEEITRENVDILNYMDSSHGAVSTTGETIGNAYFYDFSTYTG